MDLWFGRGRGVFSALFTARVAASPAGTDRGMGVFGIGRWGYGPLACAGWSIGIALHRISSQVIMLSMRPFGYVKEKITGPALENAFLFTTELFPPYCVMVCLLKTVPKLEPR